MDIAASSDGLRAIPRRSYAIQLQFLLPFPSVCVLSLFQLDFEDRLYLSQLLLITILEGSLLLTEEALDVPGDPLVCCLRSSIQFW